MKTKKELLERIKKLELQITQLAVLVDILNEDFRNLYEDYVDILHKYCCLKDKVNSYCTMGYRYNPKSNYTNVMLTYTFVGMLSQEGDFTKHLMEHNLLGE